MTPKPQTTELKNQLHFS